jgi:cyclopropane fatty-acyl-phospholipid synthase-like methyltransferase
MPEIRSILSLPPVYRLFWNLIGGPKYINVFMKQYVQPKPGLRILDIGCGPGTTVPYFPGAEYVGFDISEEYVAAARLRYPQATFVCERISQYSLFQRSYFDVVLALGIIHHLDDREAQQLFQIAQQALRPDGKLVTFDGVFTDSQSFIARWLVRGDRGKFVRRQEGYVRLASEVFRHVKATVHHDLLRVPYSHLIMECSALSS